LRLYPLLVFVLVSAAVAEAVEMVGFLLAPAAVPPLLELGFLLGFDGDFTDDNGFFFCTGFSRASLSLAPDESLANVVSSSWRASAIIAARIFDVGEVGGEAMVL